MGPQSATDTAPALYFYHPDHLGSTAMVTDLDGHITQNVVYIPYGEVFVEERNGSWASPYLFNAKELDEETGLYYYGARYLNPSIALWLSTDPLQGKYPGMSPYNYCAGNPVKLVDPDGEAWKPVGDMEGNPTGYVWVNPKDSYEKDGKLKKGLYEQAIYFSHGGKNGYYLSSNNGYNMGTSTATVYKADGSTEDYDACTFPANTEKYATVPQGKFEAKVGMHNSKYLALRLSEKGTKNFIKNFINLFSQNPSKRNRTNYAYGINIHKAGKNNYTGEFKKNGKIHGVSEGCLLIDVEKWDDFMSNFTDKKESLISVSVSRCLPSDHVYYGPFSELIPFRDSGAHICQPDATRVSSDYYKR